LQNVIELDFISRYLYVAVNEFIYLKLIA